MPSVVKGLFGGSSRAENRLQNFRPTGFSAPGLIASQGGGGSSGGRGISGFMNRVVSGQGQGGVTLTRTEGMNTALEGLMAGLAGRSRAFGTLLGKVTPGFGDLTRARVQAIRDAGSRTVGNLRSDLNQRRVLGSGFAQREIASTEAMFAQEEERARAEATVQELEMSRQLIGETFSGAIQASLAAISQFNFETEVAANLTTSTNELMAANNRAQAEAASASEGGAFELLGTIAGAAILASDRRLKTNIVRIGTRNGYPWYEFDYLSGRHSEGVMADEIPRHHVIRINGYDYVNYKSLLE